MKSNLTDLQRQSLEQLGDALVCVTFDSEKSRAEFEAAWIERTGGEPIDEIVDGVQYSGDNADRARDIANEVVGVTVQS